jgi:hypothetical protein
MKIPHQCVNMALCGEVVVRDGGFRLCQTLCNCSTHIRKWNVHKVWLRAESPRLSRLISSSVGGHVRGQNSTGWA